MFPRRIQQSSFHTAQAPKLTEELVIRFVAELDDESYRKLSKKFTAHRNLRKELKSIDDGDIEDAAAAARFEETEKSSV